MAGIDNGVVGQREQPVFYAGDELVEVAAVEVGSSDAAGEKDVA